MLPGPTGWADTKLLFYFGRHSFGSFQYSRLASSRASYIPYTAQGNGSCWACLLFIGIASKGFWHTPASWWTAEQMSICLGHASWVFAEYSRAEYSRGPCRSTRWDCLLRTSCVVAGQMGTAPAKSSFGYSLCYIYRERLHCCRYRLTVSGETEQGLWVWPVCKPWRSWSYPQNERAAKAQISPCNDNSWGHGEGDAKFYPSNSQKMIDDLQEMPRSHVFHPTKANLVPRSLFREPVTHSHRFIQRRQINISSTYRTRSGGGKKWLESC